MKHDIVVIGTALARDLRRLIGQQYNLIAVNSTSAALAALKKSQISTVLVDHFSSPTFRLEAVGELKAAYPDLNVISVGVPDTCDTESDTAVCERLACPLDRDVLIERLQQVRVQKSAHIEPDRYGHMVGRNPAMLKVFATVKKVADAECAVLICGEHGTGKELVARRLHFESFRRNHPFIAVSCGALAPTLLESELFGHERGAFTGAYQTNKGRFERAGKGTIFLDEVADIVPALQAKLLRALQEREFEKVGGNHSQKITARLIAATNKNLEVAVKENLFREDLYYRLNVINIFLPPLRCRGEDIPLLTDYFLKKYGKTCGREGISVSDETMRIFEQYRWPGNVRELEYQIWRTICLCDSDIIKPEDLSLGIRGALKDRRRVIINREVGEISLPEAVESVEKRMIYRALKKTNYVKAKAARLLGITERMLTYKIQKRNIEMNG